MAGPRVDAVERTVSCGQARAVPNPLADPTRKCNISYILTLWNPKDSGLETLISIVGGVALLLWGVRMVRTGATRSFGAELRRMLALYAQSRLTAFASGLAVTGPLQSGTATPLIIPTFAPQGLTTSPAASPIIICSDTATPPPLPLPPS